MPSLCKHHLDTADAKRPKHHLDTSRKPPKPQAKKLFHVTFGLHIKQSLEPQSTCPAYANTIWNHIKQLWSHRAHAQPMQTPSGHCRCKKTQTPSRHERKKKFGLKTSRRAPPLGGVGGFIHCIYIKMILALHEHQHSCTSCGLSDKFGCAKPFFIQSVCKDGSSKCVSEACRLILSDCRRLPIEMIAWLMGVFSTWDNHRDWLSFLWTLMADEQGTHFQIALW